MSEKENYIIFLGTGTSTGVPVLSCTCQVCRSKESKDHRLRTSAFIQIQNTRLIIDCGPDFRQQLLRNNITDFDAILLTHGHRDHIAGLDEVRAFNYIRNKTIDVYASEDVSNAIKTEFPYIFNPKDYKGPPKINLHIIDDKTFKINNLEIQPLPIIHGKMPILGFRINDLSYITDASFIPDKTMKLIKDSPILVINALRTRPHPTHFSLDEAIEVAEISDSKQCFFTHISHFMGLHKEVNTNLPKHISLAHDMLKINF